MSSDHQPQRESDDSLEDQTPQKDLGRATMSAGVYTMVSQVATTLIRTAGLMVLARIIAPKDFGLIAKVASIVGLTTLIGDFGISIPIIQSKQITQRQLSGLFWVIVGVGFVLALAVSILSPVLAWFYTDPRVIPVALMSAISLLLRTPATHHTAILRRRLHFGSLAAVEVVSAIVSVVIAIVFAKLGFGYWSLLLQSLAFAIVSTIGAWIATGWFPDWHFSLGEIKDKLKMGGDFTAGNILNYFARNGDNVLIARVWGETACGLYTKAYGLLLLPLRQIGGPMGKVAVPALSRLQDQPERYKSFFYKGCTISFVLQIPITIFAAFSGREIVLAMLGPAWVAAVPIFIALTPTLFISTTAPATSWVFLSRGETDRWLKVVLVNSALTILGFIIGVQFGPEGVAWAFSVVTVLIRIPNILYCFQPTPLKLSEFLALMIPAVTCSILAWFVGYVIVLNSGWSSVWSILALKALVFFAVYFVTIAMTSSGKMCFETIRPHLPKIPSFRASTS